MMTNRLRTLFSRAKEIYQEEGLKATIKRVSAFVISPMLDEYGIFYVYERTLEKGNEVDYLPKIPNVTHRIIATIEQLHELTNEGYDLSLIDVDEYHSRLKERAILSLLFVDREFASLSLRKPRMHLIGTHIRLTSQTMRFVVEVLG
jgi:hypothetical protein